MRLMEIALPRVVPSWYRVLVGDVTVDVEDGFQEATLASLLAVVRSC